MAQNKQSIQHWLKESTEKLAITSTTSRLDAEILLMHVLKTNRTFLYTHFDTLLTENQISTLHSLLKTYLSGMPIAYILGEKEFWSMSFKVSPAVLIPRPETEHLVEIVLNQLDSAKPQRILELGTGSGAIAIALKKERLHWSIIACDNSEEALLIARENAAHLLPAKKLISPTISFQYSHWFEQIPSQTFSAIISNPPYIAQDDPHLKALTYEPINALTSGSDGLEDIREIITQSPNYLEPNGYLFLEHGYTQAAAISEIFQSMGFTKITTHCDLAGHDRITSAQNISRHSKHCDH